MTNANNQYSVDLARFFIERFAKDGRVVAELDYLQSANDFRSQLAEVRRHSPDVVFVPGYPRDSAFIIRQARSLGIDSIFLGGDGWDDLMYDYAGSEIVGSYFAEHWHVDMPDPRSADFVRRYASRHRRFRTGLVALTYDAVCLLSDAVQRAGTPDPTAIRDALAATRNFSGIAGRVVFDENGDPRKPVVILRFDAKAAAFHRVMNMEPTAPEGDAFP
jgi:branched-chain amino acid transport system substrate-binding protein